MGWILAAAAVFVVLFLAYAWTSTHWEHDLRRRQRRLSPRKARRAELRAWEQHEDATRAEMSDRRLAPRSRRGVLSSWGFMGGGGAHLGIPDGEGADGAGGDGGDGGD